MTVALLIVYFVLAGFIAYRRPTLAVAGLLVVLPLYGVRFSILGVPGTLLELSIWAIFLGWFIREWRLHGPPPLAFAGSVSRRNPFWPYPIPILLWEAAALVAVAVSPNVTAALGVWKAYFIDPLLVFVLIVSVFRGHPDRRWVWVLYGLGLSAAAISAVAWYQKVTGFFVPEPWAHTVPLRVTSAYSYPNAVGLFVGPVLAMYSVWLLQNIVRGQWRTRAFGFQCLVVTLGTGAIIFSVTRGAWVGVVAAAVAGTLLVFRSAWGKIVVALVIVGLTLAAIPTVRERVLTATLESPSGKIRRIVWQETWAMLKDHPLTGAGLAGYQTALIPYHHPWHKEASPYALEIFLYPHNVFLNFWSEIGLGGLLVFLWILIIFARIVWQQRSEALAQIAAAAMVALLVHGFVDVPYFKNDLAVLFWVIAALPLLDADVNFQAGLAGGGTVG